MAIHSETFTSLTEFVKNHLVKINKISVSLSKTVSLISQRSEYFKLYKDLMKFWESKYGERIYSLKYENFTIDQENQTRKLIEHLELNWEEACLSPHKNKRSVRTASQQQVRQKIYQGSSEGWRKYEPYLNGAFDSLQSL